jgi:hypothetical protein
MTRKAQKPRPTGPKTLTGGKDAKRHTAVILEVLAGLRGPTEGSEAMGVSLSRYYQLETRALQGMIAALEPRPKGRRQSAEQERDGLKSEKRRLEREVTRLQSLLRAAERTVGISPVPKKTKAGKLGGKGQSRRVRHTTVVRARKAIDALRQERKEAAAAAEPSGKTTTKA